MSEVVLVLRSLVSFQESGEICILRVKDRFQEPTPAGWADVMVNAVFADDRYLHVFELQIYHHDLLTVRKDIGGHEGYSRFRASREISELLGVANVRTCDVNTRSTKVSF